MTADRGLAGIVAIGRNEGERLRRCLASAQAQATHVVYVDSGSTDGSPELARSAGVQVVDLDLSVPFTAARARNAGARKLAEIAPELRFVQFVDGDCELVGGWIERALGAVDDPHVAIIAGRRRERHPRRTVYNLLCEIEWDTPVGDASDCGGDALVRVAAFADVGGFDDSLIAGEEPDLCHRLRTHGWRILRIAGDMTIHDAAIEHFSQWWRRNVRSGHAYAEVSHKHRRDGRGFWRRETFSNWVWGACLPLVAVSLAPLTRGASLLFFALYLVLAARVYRSETRPDFALRDRVAWALACALGKLPQARGQLQFHWSRSRRRAPSLIEYKGTSR